MAKTINKPKFRKAKMKKNTKYTNEKRLDKNEEVFITEKYMGHQRYQYTAFRKEGDKEGFKVTRSEFDYTEKEKYIVTVTRISYSTRNIEVEADDRKQAERLADEEAGSLEFSEQNAEYKIDGVMSQEEMDRFIGN